MKLVQRAEWGARSPRYVNKAKFTAPSTGHWNGPHINPVDHSKCASLVRGIQNFHMDSRGWSDIAYNFVICQHGYTFVGRGLDVINGANGTNPGNRTSHAIMWLAGQGNDFVSYEKQEFRACVTYVADNTLAPDAAIGHRDHHSTECPGDERYQWIHQGMPVEVLIPPNVPNVPTPQGDDMGTSATYVQTDGTLRGVVIGVDHLAYHYVGTKDPKSLEHAQGMTLPGNWLSISAVVVPDDDPTKPGTEVISGQGTDHGWWITYWTHEHGWQGPFQHESAVLLH